MQQINFRGNAEQVGDTKKFFTIPEVKGTILDFSQTTKVL